MSREAVVEAQALVGRFAVDVAFGETEREAITSDLQGQQLAYKQALASMDAELASQRAELEEFHRVVQGLEERRREAEEHALSCQRHCEDAEAAAAAAETRAVALAAELREALCAHEGRPEEHAFSWWDSLTSMLCVRPVGANRAMPRATPANREPHLSTADAEALGAL